MAWEYFPYWKDGRKGLYAALDATPEELLSWDPKEGMNSFGDLYRHIADAINGWLEFATKEAADGKQALDLCIEKLPDAVLLDWNMPVMDGPEFLRELRKLRGGDAPIVIFCTTENDMEHIQMAIESGANEYIMKPFDSEIVQAKFAQVGLL